MDAADMKVCGSTAKLGISATKLFDFHPIRLQPVLEIYARTARLNPTSASTRCHDFELR